MINEYPNLSNFVAKQKEEAKQPKENVFQDLDNYNNKENNNKEKQKQKADKNIGYKKIKTIENKGWGKKLISKALMKKEKPVTIIIDTTPKRSKFYDGVYEKEKRSLLTWN